MTTPLKKGWGIWELENEEEEKGVNACVNVTVK